MVPLFFEYAAWHYSQALADYVRVWSNIVWFLFNFFSIPLLMRTFFSPFHRLDEGYRKGFYPEDWANTFVVNSLMRLVGAIVRFTLIVMGLVVTTAAGVLGALVFAVWVLAPVMLVALVGFGLTYIAI